MMHFVVPFPRRLEWARPLPHIDLALALILKYDPAFGDTNHLKIQLMCMLFGFWSFARNCADYMSPKFSLGCLTKSHGAILKECSQALTFKFWSIGIGHAKCLPLPQPTCHSNHHLLFLISTMQADGFFTPNCFINLRSFEYKEWDEPNVSFSSIFLAIHIC